MNLDTVSSVDFRTKEGRELKQKYTPSAYKDAKRRKRNIEQRIRRGVQTGLDFEDIVHHSQRDYAYDYYESQFDYLSGFSEKTNAVEAYEFQGMDVPVYIDGKLHSRGAFDPRKFKQLVQQQVIKVMGDTDEAEYPELAMVVELTTMIDERTDSIHSYRIDLNSNDIARFYEDPDFD